MDTHSLRELEQLVEAALARHGAAGNLHADEKSISLAVGGRTASVEIGHLTAKWNDLSFADRQRECGLLARALTRQRRSFSPKPGPRRALPMGLVALVVLTLVAGAVYVVEISDEPAPQKRPVSGDAVVAELVEVEKEREARAARVCNATRTRLSRGGTVGPTDAEGWVVELALLWNATGTTTLQLDDFVTAPDGRGESRIVWGGAPELAQLSGPNTRVEVGEHALPAAPLAPQFRELRMTLHGEYVLPYFREAERIKLIRLTYALAERNSAMLGALYARCATGTAHHMGSWFLGTSPGAAASALLYYMAAHAAPPLLPREVISTREDVAFEPAFALDTLLDRTRHLQKQDVASGIGGQDGMVAGPAHFTTLGFPFVDSDRALRASFGLSRLLAQPREARAEPPNSARRKSP